LRQLVADVLRVRSNPDPANKFRDCQNLTN
jgi:hypothetical protein